MSTKGRHGATRHKARKRATDQTIAYLNERCGDDVSLIISLNILFAELKADIERDSKFLPTTTLDDSFPADKLDVCLIQDIVDELLVSAESLQRR